jgi:hypothetical protein
LAPSFWTQITKRQTAQEIFQTFLLTFRSSNRNILC